ncbi:MAG: oxidoreductase [Pseudonocardiales bacterium]
MPTRNVPDPLTALAGLPGIAAATAEARGAVDRLLAHRVLRRGSAAVSAESALRGARASAALEGTDVTLDVIRAGGGGPVVRGALRASAEIGPLSDTWSLAPAQVLARLHMLAARDLVPPELLGRPATGREVVVRLQSLGELLTGRTTPPALVVAAVVHGELLTLAPFAAANGVVARAAARLTLVTRGLDPKAVSVPEVGHAELAGQYVAAAQGYASGDVGGWIRHCCAAVVLGAREGLAVCEAVLRG